MAKKISPAPWRWLEDDFHGGLYGLVDANDQDVLVPMTQNEGDTGAAWFEEKMGGWIDFDVIAAAPKTYELLNRLLNLLKSDDMFVGFETTEAETAFNKVWDEIEAILALVDSKKEGNDD